MFFTIFLLVTAGGHPIYKSRFFLVSIVGKFAINNYYMFLYACLEVWEVCTIRLLAISTEVSCFYEPRALWLEFVLGKLITFICYSFLGNWCSGQKYAIDSNDWSCSPISYQCNRKLNLCILNYNKKMKLVLIKMPLNKICILSDQSKDEKVGRNNIKYRAVWLLIETWPNVTEWKRRFCS